MTFEQVLAATMPTIRKCSFVMPGNRDDNDADLQALCWVAWKRCPVNDEFKRDIYQMARHDC